MTHIETQGDDWKDARKMGQALGFWGWETTMRQIDDSIHIQEMSADKGVDVITTKWELT